MLDDRTEALDETHADAWRMWLRLSNALALRDWPTTITTLSRVAGEVVTPEAEPEEESADEWAKLDEQWLAVYEDAEPVEQVLLRGLAAHAGIEPPAVGHEGPGGIMLDLSWTKYQVAVDVHEMPEGDRAELTEAGWIVVDGDPDAIVAALRRRMAETAERTS